MKKNINTLLFLSAVLVLSSCSRTVSFNDAENNIYNSYYLNEIIHFLKNDTDTITLSVESKTHYYRKGFLTKYERGDVLLRKTNNYKGVITFIMSVSDEPDNFEFLDIFNSNFRGKLSTKQIITVGDTIYNSGYFIANNNDTLYCVNNLGIVKISLSNGDYYELINY